MTTVTERIPPDSRCVVCGAVARQRIATWTMRCSECGTWRSVLEPAINASTENLLDEDVRAVGLEQLRRANFRTIAARLEALRPLNGAEVLDVGCAHGWFLDTVTAHGAKAVGVEPDAAMAAVARAGGHEVVEGMFPNVVAERGPFDVIVFNDVLEHIPDVDRALTSCRRLLRPGGLLSINIPSADGIAFRVGGALARIGVDGPYERLWQYGLPSPHVHYFPPSALSALVAGRGFDVEAVEALSSIVRDGLWERVHAYRKKTPASIAEFSALWLATPLLDNSRWSDIVHIVATARSG
jgi:SAM-dependent methyltransferase